jgi:ketosteroid isomerase-like protein
MSPWIRRGIVTFMTLALMSALCAAQAASPARSSTPQPAARADSGAPDKALMQRFWDAWGTLDPAKAAPYYSKHPQNVFFDLAPMSYTGWAEYQEGVKNLLAGFRSVKFTVNDDARIMSRDDGALGFATFHAEIVNKDGTTATMEGRWTVVWHREGGKWLIVHEHVSVPLGGGPMPRGVPRLKTQSPS